MIVAQDREQPLSLEDFPSRLFPGTRPFVAGMEFIQPPLIERLSAELSRVAVAIETGRPDADVFNKGTEVLRRLERLFTGRFELELGNDRCKVSQRIFGSVMMAPAADIYACEGRLYSINPDDRFKMLGGFENVSIDFLSPDGSLAYLSRMVYTGPDPVAEYCIQPVKGDRRPAFPLNNACDLGHLLAMSPLNDLAINSHGHLFEIGADFSHCTKVSSLPLTGEATCIFAAAFDARASRIACGLQSGSLLIYDRVENRNEDWRSKCTSFSTLTRDQEVTSVGFLADGERLILTSVPRDRSNQSGTLQVLKFESGPDGVALRELARADYPMGIWKAWYSDRNQELYIHDRSGMLKVYDLSI
jgi:hypothetical protein